MNSFHTASNARQSGIDLLRRPASSSPSPNQSDPGPQSQDTATAFRDSYLPGDNIARPITSSQGHKIDPDNCDTDRKRTDINSPMSDNGTQDVRHEIFHGDGSLCVPIACMTKFSWQIGDRSWDTRYFSDETLELLNFCINYRDFKGYFAIPWHDAEHWRVLSCHACLFDAEDKIRNPPAGMFSSTLLHPSLPTK